MSKRLTVHVKFAWRDVEFMATKILGVISVPRDATQSKSMYIINIKLLLLSVILHMQ